MFDLKQYTKNFSGIDKTPEGIREAAQAILKNKDALRMVFSNSSTETWANQALGILDGLYGNSKKSDVERASEAFRWLSGSAQSSKAKKMQVRAKDNRKEAQKKIANFASNKANVLDIPADASPKERAALEAKAKEIDADIAKWIGIGDALGVNTKAAQSLVRTESGFIPSADVEATKAAGAVPGGPAPVVPTGLSSSGPTLPTQVGQPLPVSPGGDTRPAGPYKSSVLDSAGINYTGLTDDQVKQAEATYLAAQNDTTLQQKVINNLDITDEDIKGFLDTAKSEYSDYYKQQFSRGSEDFTKSLEFATAQREDQLAKEKLDKQLALEQSAGQTAEAGLATSGIRKKLEDRINTNAENIAQSDTRAFDYSTYGAGRNAEDILGSSTVAGLKLPEIGGNPVYSPAGNISGSLQREQTTAEQTRAADLEKLARERRTEILAGEGGVTTMA